MKNYKLLIVIVVLILLFAGYYLYKSYVVVDLEETGTSDEMIEVEDQPEIEEQPDVEDQLEAEEQPETLEQPEIEDRSVAAAGTYIDYSKEDYELNRDNKRVLFFHASWCPYCQAADREFNANPGEIPEDVVLFKVDYDTEKELIEKYGITYQHTFVLVDEDGNEITKWNGGDIDNLKKNT